MAAVGAVAEVSVVGTVVEATVVANAGVAGTGAEVPVDGDVPRASVGATVAQVSVAGNVADVSVIGVWVDISAAGVVGMSSGHFSFVSTVCTTWLTWSSEGLAVAEEDSVVITGTGTTVVLKELGFIPSTGLQPRLGTHRENPLKIRRQEAHLIDLSLHLCPVAHLAI